MHFYLANFILAILPPTRLFGLKRFLLCRLGIFIGEGTRVCGAVKFYGGGRVLVGAECWVGLGASFYTSPGADVEIGDRCDIAPQVAFMCGSHELGTPERRAGNGKASTIRVGAGTWLGIRSILLGGVEVGASSIVGAGSLLLPGAYPENSLLLGAPAKVKREL